MIIIQVYIIISSKSCPQLLPPREYLYCYKKYYSQVQIPSFCAPIPSASVPPFPPQVRPNSKLQASSSYSPVPSSSTGPVAVPYVLPAGSSAGSSAGGSAGSSAGSCAGGSAGGSAGSSAGPAAAAAPVLLPPPALPLPTNLKNAPFILCSPLFIVAILLAIVYVRGVGRGSTLRGSGGGL